MRTLIGCCLIHLGIGSIYSLSVLYPSIVEHTGWDNTVLVIGFALAILALGLTASVHQQFLHGMRVRQAILLSLTLWLTVQNFMTIVIIDFYEYILAYYVFSSLLGVSIGCLYVIPINLVTNYGYKRIGLASGLVVCCFGLGSILAAKVYATISLDDLFAMNLVYYGIMLLGMFLIEGNGVISSPISFSRDKQWYLLAAIFFMNIGIGISLLSNLTQLSLMRGFSLDDAVLLVALAGIANTCGRLFYSTISDWIGKINVLGIVLGLQLVSIIGISYGYWNSNVVLIISVYGGVFAIMPSLMKSLYNTTAAYSQVLAMWGLAGLICPILFNYIGFPLLVVLSSLTIASYFFLRKSL